jgi:Uma2 family endonuclease
MPTACSLPAGGAVDVAPFALHFSAMRSTKARPITRHEYAFIPEGAPRQQLIEGDLIMAPSPSSFHQSIVLNLALIMGNYLRVHPVGKVLVSPLDTYLSDINVYQPDLLFIRKENLGILAEHGVEGAPDLAVEILSKTSAKYDLGVKRSMYARTGVEELWIIDPSKRTLALYRLGENAESPAATYRGKQRFSSMLLPDLTIDLADVFAS